MSKIRNLLVALGTIVALGAGAGSYWYFKVFNTSGGVLGAAALVPDQALLTTFVSTDDQQWSAANNLGSPAVRDLVGDRASSLQTEILQGSNLSYETDLEPWIDGIMVSVLPPTEVRSQSGQEPNLLIIVGIKDKLKALEFSNKMKSQKDMELKSSDYKGVEMVELSKAGATSTYSAVLGNYVAFSPEKRSVEWAIDTSKGGASLKDQPGAAKALGNGLNLDNSIAQLYIPDYGGLINQQLANSDQPPLSPNALKQLEALDNVVAGIGVEKEGIRIRALVELGETQENPFVYESSPGKILNVLPGDTLALLSGQNPQSFWQSFVKQSETNPELQVVVEGVKRQLEQLKLDPEQDVFSWMTGEFALAALPSSDKSILGAIGVAGAIVIESNDPDRTNTMLGKLDQLVEGNLTVEKTEVASKAVTYWRLPQGLFANQAFLGYGWLNPTTLFVALGDTAPQSLLQPTALLTQNPEFQSLVTTLPKENGGYFYFKVAGLKEAAQAAEIGGQYQALPVETQALIESVQSVGITTSQPSPQVSQVDVFFHLPPSTDPTPEPQ
ncbi:MAG: DUF3352 domain-containing protein [Prochlorotrichaceae cyanobacterium]|jgi:hypothetical protein